MAARTGDALGRVRAAYREVVGERYTPPMLRLVSALNWVHATLLVVVGAWFALMTFSSDASPFGIVVLVLCFALAAPFAYLGAVIEKGRGRGLQTGFRR